MAYNGWTNYETWNVSLWIDNEQSSYWHAQELTQEHAGDDYPELRLADALEEWISDQNPLAGQASMFSDLLGAALKEVNWREIAEHYLADYEPEENEEEEEGETV